MAIDIFQIIKNIIKVQQYKISKVRVTGIYEWNKNVWSTLLIFFIKLLINYWSWKSYKALWKLEIKKIQISIIIIKHSKRSWPLYCMLNMPNKDSKIE